MQLSEYPTAIAKLQAEVFDLDLLIDQTHTTVKQIEAEIDSAIAFDQGLKNDAQRKARRQQLLDQHPNYWEQQEILSQYRTKRESCFIQLCLRRNEFSVLKLEKREAIARLELQANS
ncbi:hypothetical protein SD81_028535 [Tolypothrix campylonemoides VB511288]|nr:hypothetical protein SD81_028535 [Tolypothrix campylonemoides VB511288]